MSNLRIQRDFLPWIQQPAVRPEQLIMVNKIYIGLCSSLSLFILILFYLFFTNSLVKEDNNTYYFNKSSCINRTFYNYCDTPVEGTRCDVDCVWWPGNYENRTMRRCWVWHCGDNGTKSCEFYQAVPEDQSWVECE